MNIKVNKNIIQAKIRIQGHAHGKVYNCVTFMTEMAGLSAPTMDWASTDVPQVFKKFKTICQLMFDGPLAEKTEAVKVKYLLLWSGEEGIDVSSTFK